MTQKLKNYQTYAAQPGTLYLLRPDGLIAARGLDFPVDRLADTLQLASGWKMPGVAANSLQKFY